MNGRRMAISLSALVAALGLGACGASSPHSASPAVDRDVVVAGQMFTPMAVTIPVGGEVTWKFQDGGLPHDIMFATFKSRAMSSGTYSHTFTKVGVYTYHCGIHPWMTGTVTVTAASPD